MKIRSPILACIAVSLLLAFASIAFAEPQRQTSAEPAVEKSVTAAAVYTMTASTLTPAMRTEPLASEPSIADAKCRDVIEQKLNLSSVLDYPLLN